MLLIVIIFLLFAILIVLFLFFTDKNASFSDQTLHVLFIDLIRKNKNKFIVNCDNFLIQSKMTYPQLLHWGFSFIPKYLIPKATLFSPAIFSIVSLLSFLFFVFSVHPYLAIYKISLEKFLLLCGLLFVSTPYSYNIINAKNMGISARGLGLFLGQLYTYSMVLFILHDSYSYFIIACFLSLLIFMSSQFASQHIFFSTILLTIFYQSFILLIPIVVSVISFFLITPRLAYQFFYGNINYKKFYYKYLAKSHILMYRESIWKDIFWEIWKLLLTKKKPKGGGTLFMYIYTNPIVILLFSLPLTVPICLYFMFNLIQKCTIGGYDNFVLLLTMPIIISLFLFLLFSFRETRFLGEPERYVEFTIGFMSVTLVLLLCEHLYIIYGILSFQFLLVFLQVYASRIRIKRKIKNLQEGLIKINNIINENLRQDDEIRLLSNNTEIMRLLTDSRKKVFYGSLYSEWYGKFHYTDLYYNFNEMKADMILPVIEEFNISHFVLDTNILSYERFNSLIKTHARSFKQLIEKDNLIAYKIC